MSVTVYYSTVHNTEEESKPQVYVYFEVMEKSWSKRDMISRLSADLRYFSLFFQFKRKLLRPYYLNREINYFDRPLLLS